jgi:hypothetical protein
MFAHHLAASVFLSFGAFSAAAAACSPSDISIKQADWHKEGSSVFEPGKDRVELVGEITNNCQEPTGIQLQAVFRDASGKVVATYEFWPAVTRNIAPRASYAFSAPATVTTDAASMSMSVIDARPW